MSQRRRRSAHHIREGDLISQTVYVIDKDERTLLPDNENGQSKYGPPSPHFSHSFSGLTGEKASEMKR